MHRYSFITTVIVILLAVVFSTVVFAQKAKVDPFTQLIDEIQSDLVNTPDRGFTVPTEEELRDFASALKLFQNGSKDSCIAVLKKFHYTLERVADIRAAGTMYDVIREERPVHRGWGTFIYNEHFAKQLNIHVNHPYEDANALSIGADLFRGTHAAWFLVAGTGKKASIDKISSDIARAHVSIFQRLHESLTDVSHLTLSVHSYTQKYYSGPLASTDIVLSNGTTTDEQWGISPISLAYRDSLRRAGFSCALAMYDSGYGALSANTNPQAIYSNESVGFGHWINVELSNSVRENAEECARFIQITDRSLDLSGKKLTQQSGHIFGLVSPRVVRFDSAHPIMFPPPGQQTYRIISFNTSRSRNDTLNIHAGSWLNLFNSDRSMARIQEIDSASGIIHEFRQKRINTSRNVLASIVEDGTAVPASSDGLRTPDRDSSLADADGADGFEPIQVHRIPLQPMVLTPGMNQGEIITTSYRWNGVLQSGYAASVPTFRMSAGRPVISETDMLPNFLIPIMSNSYRTAGSKFVGVQMTKVLVEEIARLVTDQEHPQQDVNLVAEENENGDYYLRIVPTPQPLEIAELKK